jgi:predicted acylesterase/phospholipase RssA
VTGRSPVVLFLLLALAACVWADLPEREPVSVTPPVRIGLALSGGAALGLAHIGVLKVLDREGIPVVAISGTSMGALVGGLYSAGYSPMAIESLVDGANWDVLFSSGVPFGAQYLPERQQAQRYVLQLRHRNLVPSVPGGLLPMQNVEFLLMRLLSQVEHNTGYDFDSLPTSYRAVAVDLVTGNKQVLRRGRLEQAIRSSIAIPGAFAPEKLDSMELVDGGVQQNLPVDPLLECSSDFIIAVLTMKRTPETGVSLIDIASRTLDIIGVEDLARQKSMADVVIEPNVDPFRHSDFARARDLIAAGEAAAEAALPVIRAKLAEREPVACRRVVRERPMPVVRSVRFEGLHTTSRATARHEVNTRPGEALEFGKLLDDLGRLFHTGLFEDVNYRLDSLTRDSVDVVIEMTERAYGFYLLGVRYDNIDDVGLGFEVGQGNLGGSGASARAALTLGNPTELRAGITGTRLFRLPFGYRADALWGDMGRDFHEDDSAPAMRYSSHYAGGLLEAGYILGRNAFFTAGVEGTRVSYEGPRPIDTLRPEWVSGLTFDLEHNSFDNLDLPTRGRTFSVGAFVSSRRLASSRDFIAASVAGEGVVALGRRVALRPGLTAGACLGNTPFAKYLHSGEPGLVGFSHDEFTTKQRLILRMGADCELVKLFNRPDYPLYLQLLSNIGAFEWPERLAVSDVVSTLHWGAGVGLRTNTPIGPLQVVLSYGDFLRDDPHAGGLNFYLSVGREFRYTR